MLCLVKVIIIGCLTGQTLGYNSRFFHGDTRSYYNNDDYYNGPVAFPPQPNGPPMYDDAGFAPHSLYKTESIHGPILHKREFFNAEPSFYQGGNAQPGPMSYRDRNVPQNPELCEDEVAPQDNTMFREQNVPYGSTFYNSENVQQGGSSTFQKEVPQQRQEKPVYYRQENVQEGGTKWKTTLKGLSYNKQGFQPFGLAGAQDNADPCVQPNPCLPPYQIAARPQTDFKPQTKTPSYVNFKKIIEPSRENYNTLRTVLRLPVNEPPQYAPNNPLPTIIIQDTPNVPVFVPDNIGFSDEDDIDDEVDSAPVVQPNTVNQPYQFFQSVVPSNNKINTINRPNGHSFTNDADCNQDSVSLYKSDMSHFMQVLRTPITILPSRFPPRIEQILERIQSYFSNYNLDEHKRPVSTPMPITTITTTTPIAFFATSSPITETSGTAAQSQPSSNQMQTVYTTPVYSTMRTGGAHTTTPATTASITERTGTGATASATAGTKSTGYTTARVQTGASAAVGASAGASVNASSGAGASSKAESSTAAAGAAKSTTTTTTTKSTTAATASAATSQAGSTKGKSGASQSGSGGTKTSGGSSGHAGNNSKKSDDCDSCS
ncbi:hypothetical protein RUM44_013560 [Polyplax serrata]|uniref:Uncharacterized protein n=1 Tax=Polyplax serrata TaxID=468196 RepID=A0ABR1BEU8_POLSC